MEEIKTMNSITCYCGNNVILKNQTNCCKKCSSVYDQSGNFMQSRHNWNFNDYFNSKTFFKKDFRLSTEAPELNPFEL